MDTTMPKVYAKQARADLDHKAAAWRKLPGSRPHGGWVRAIRDALGMSAADLGDRMGLSQARVSQIEAGELDRSITLGTLERAADALGCDVVYALVPRLPLEQMVQEQALAKARQRLAPVAHSMALEDQTSTPNSAVRIQLESLAQQLIDRRGLWSRSG